MEKVIPKSKTKFKSSRTTDEDFFKSKRLEKVL